jgi:cyanophycin synthetase
MEPTATSIYSGPSVYAQRPVVCHTLGGWEELPERYFDKAFLEDLLARLPGLAAHFSACASAGSAASESEAPADDGPKKLRVDHLFEHVCIELQNLAGGSVECVRADRAARKGALVAAVAYEEADVCVEAGRLAGDLIGSLLPSDLPSSTTEAFDFARRFDDFVSFAQGRMLPVQDRALLRAARERDVPTSRVVGRVVQLGHGCLQQRLSATKTSHTNVVSNDLAANKDYARRILGDLGLPIPRYERVYRARDVSEAAKRLGYPVVVKPNNGSMGGGVSVGMKNGREVRAAYRRAREFGRSVLVEEVVEGADYRMLVINGELCAASKRVPGHVVGDGSSTIEELVAQLNSDPRRGTGPTSSWTRIDFDEQADRLLAGLGFTRRSIPAAGEEVYLRRNANTSDGGTAIDVTDEVHPDNREIAVRAAKGIGLDIAGVDFLTKDIAESMWESGGSICEINSRPGLRKHIWPAVGKPRDVTTPIVDMLFPSGGSGRVPIVAVTGTGPTATTARMLAHVLEGSGYHVGLGVGHRVHIGGRVTGSSRLTAPAAARMILMDPDVDVAVLEVTPDDVLRHGLGFDACDVSMVVGDPSSEVPDDFVEAYGVVARTTRDVVLLAADDPACEALAGQSGAELCLIASGASEKAASTKAAFKRAVSKKAAFKRAEAQASERRAVSNGRVVSLSDSSGEIAEIPIARLENAPKGEGDSKSDTSGDTKGDTRGDGDLMLQCVVFASVAAYSLGKDPGDIHRSILGFAPEMASDGAASLAEEAPPPESPEPPSEAAPTRRPLLGLLGSGRRARKPS